MKLAYTLIVVLISIMMKLDSRMFGRLNFERPLLTCTICGLLLGNWFSSWSPNGIGNIRYDVNWCFWN